MNTIMKCLSGLLVFCLILSGCATTDNTTSDNDPLTIYLWDTDLIKDLTPYLHEQFPDTEIEFIAGNNDTDLYSYLQEHGELPDIITVRRFSGSDATDLQPYLMDFTSYDVVSEFTTYSLQYYKNKDSSINWLPICGIPQTIIANQSLFEQYGLELPESYEDYVNVCKTFYENGIKPYSMDLAEDWSSHELIQAAGISELTSLEGLEWRSQAESAKKKISFDDTMWESIFSNTQTLLNDSCFTQEDLNVDTEQAMQLFVSGQAAMFHGSPVHMKQCQEQMDANLVRIPYFSQTSKEGYIYMTPSLHIAFNKELEKDSDKLDTALKVLDCMISQEGQTLIANGSSVISFNPNVSSITDDMTGLEKEINNNNYYIRYASQKSFDASFKVVTGLLTGSMDVNQAYYTFKSALNGKQKDDLSTITFKKEYLLSLDEKNSRPAASSILTTIRKDQDATLALAPYYYFTSSIYKGKCSDNRLSLMIATKPNDSSLYKETMTGSEIKELVNDYLEGLDSEFHPSTKYELPIASGMKLVVKKKDSGFVLQDILVNGKSIQENKEYSILLSDGLTKDELTTLSNTTLSSSWLQAIKNRSQCEENEDYIEVK